GDAATEREAVGALILDRLADARGERVDDRLLVRRRQVGETVGSDVADLVEQRRLQPAEAEVVIARIRAREVERRGVAALGGGLDQRPAGIAEPEDAR